LRNYWGKSGYLNGFFAEFLQICFIKHNKSALCEGHQCPLQSAFLMSGVGEIMELSEFMKLSQDAIAGQHKRG